MHRQHKASEPSSSVIEELNAEILNLTSQHDIYVSENYSLSEEVEMLRLREDRLSFECANQEELNSHLHEDNCRLRVDVQRLSNSLTTARNLHSTSCSNYKTLEEDYNRVVSVKNNLSDQLHNARQQSANRLAEIDNLKKRVEFLERQSKSSSSRQKPSAVSPSSKPISRRSKPVQIDAPKSGVLKSPYGPGWDDAYHGACQELEASKVEIARLDHLYSDVQKTLETSIFQSEGRSRGFLDRFFRCAFLSC
jgi:chromosome segregation ATPase